MQGLLPAGWLAFAARESNPLDRYERFQLVLTIVLLSCRPDATTLRRPAESHARAPRIPVSFSPPRGSGAPRRRGVLARHPWRAVAHQDARERAYDAARRALARRPRPLAIGDA